MKEPNFDNVGTNNPQDILKNSEDFKQVLGLTNEDINSMDIFQLEKAIEKYEKIKGGK